MVRSLAEIESAQRSDVEDAGKRARARLLVRFMCHPFVGRLWVLLSVLCVLAAVLGIMELPRILDTPRYGTVSAPNGIQFQDFFWVNSRAISVTGTGHLPGFTRRDFNVTTDQLNGLAISECRCGSSVTPAAGNSWGPPTEEPWQNPDADPLYSSVGHRSDGAVMLIETLTNAPTVDVLVRQVLGRSQRVLGRVKFPSDTQVITGTVSPDGRRIAWLTFIPTPKSLVERLRCLLMGRKAACERQLQLSCTTAIFLSNVDGSALRLLGSNTAKPGMDLSIYTGELRFITNGLHWSPSSDRFAYIFGCGSQNELFVWRTE